MSAGSRKKHSSAHKGFQAADDQLEVSSLIAGAGNGRDVKERLGGSQRITEREDIKPEDMVFGNAPEFTGIVGKPALEVEVADDAPPEQANISIVLDEQGQPPKQPESVPTTSGNGRIGQAILAPSVPNQEPVELDLTSNPPSGYVPEHITNTDKLFMPPKEIVSNKYVGQDIRAFVVRVGSKLEGELGVLLTTMIELHARYIKGLTTGFQVGPYTNTQTRAVMKESEATICLTEKFGRPFDRTLHGWADRYNDYQIDSEKRMPASHKKIELEDVTVDVLFIEPDFDGNVQVAWLGKNLYPSHYSGLESFKLEEGDAHGTQGSRFQLAGQYSRNPSVDKRAQEKLDSLNEAPWVEQ